MSGGIARTVYLRNRTLRVLDTFHADQVEGPLRLFNQQDILFSSTKPVVQVAGRYEQGHPKFGEAIALNTNDGQTYFSVDTGFVLQIAMRGLAAVGYGFTGLLGSTEGSFTRSINSEQTIWENLGVKLNGAVYDLDSNLSGGRIVAVVGDDPLDRKLWITEDIGDTWFEPDVVPANFGPLREVKYYDGTWIVVGAGGILRSTDNATTWEETTYLAGIVYTCIDKNQVSGRWIAGTTGGYEVYWSDDDGLTWEVGSVVNPGSKVTLNIAWGPVGCPAGTWLADMDDGFDGSKGPNGGVMYSLDDGVTWEYPANQPRPPQGWNPNDLAYASNLATPGFFAVGSPWYWDSPPSLPYEGGVFFSEDGIVWEELLMEEDIGFYLAAQLTPATIPRTFDWQLVVDRYSQVQKWADNVTSLETDNGSELIFRVSKDERWRGRGLVNADRDWQTDGEDRTIAHTRTGYARDPVCDSNHPLPRSKSWRIHGGYLQVHGDVARVSRIYCYPEEVNNIIFGSPVKHTLGVDLTLGFWTAAELELNP